MNIYATLCWLKFPRYGDEYIGCEWIRVSTQGVPPHIGTPKQGFGYEGGDPSPNFRSSLNGVSRLSLRVGLAMTHRVG